MYSANLLHDGGFLRQTFSVFEDVNELNPVCFVFAFARLQRFISNYSVKLSQIDVFVYINGGCDVR